MFTFKNSLKIPKEVNRSHKSKDRQKKNSKNKILMMNRDELSCAGSVSSPDPLAVTFKSTTYIYMMCTTQYINNMGDVVITKYILTYQMFSDAS